MIRELYRNWISPQQWMERVGVRAPMQIVIGLVLLTASLLLVTCDLRLFPTKDDQLLQLRARLVEIASRQVALAASENNLNGLRSVLTGIVGRDGVLSACVRKRNGVVVAETPGHETYWAGASDTGNTLTHMRSVLEIGNQPRGELEVAFSAPSSSAGWRSWWPSQTGTFVIFLMCGEFILYWLFLSRMLTALDPSEAVPDRMQLLMDTLVEGMAILDDHGYIVMTNQSFAQTAFLPTEQLIGRKLSSLSWTALDGNDGSEVLPWESASMDGVKERGVPLLLRISASHVRRLNVNVSPITSPDGKRRGLLVTFDDQTAIEKDNLELSKLLTRFGTADERIRDLHEQLATKAHLQNFETLDQLAKVADELATLCRLANGNEEGAALPAPTSNDHLLQETK